MIEYSKQINELATTLANIKAVSAPELLGVKIKELSAKSADPALWDDPSRAQEITSQLAHLQSRLRQVQEAEQHLEDVKALFELADEVEGEEQQDLVQEAKRELGATAKQLEKMEIQTLLAGEYDQRNAVVTIRSGTGGVDAADFAQMLLRMYLRWAERKGYQTTVMDTSYAEEAGIKSATFEVSAPYAYGTLSVEGGTHRLVRQSPFDNQARRQTSFAAVEVIPLIESQDQIDIPENELKIDVFRSSGPGGQSVNTTDSAVRMTHLPTGLVVSMQNEKSQLQNRAAALRVLQSRLLQLKRVEEQEKKRELAGDIKASWGDQMRSYVLHPYKLVKDLRTGCESSQVDNVLDGDLDQFLDAGIRYRYSQEHPST